jgi:hypothetical protein
VTFTTTTPFNRWHHVVYTSDPTGNALYVDGAAMAGSYAFGSAATQCFLGDATPDADDPADTMRVGELYYNSTSYGNWRGGIADMRIYSRALTHAEIVDLYHTTNRHVIHANEVLGAARIFEVQSEATGDGVYNCHEQTLDATEWDDTAGDSKVDDWDTTSVEVLNLAEFDPEATYVAQLAAGDLLLAFRYWDDEANFRWVGVPWRKDDGNRPRIAYVTSAPGAVDYVTAELDYLDSGTSITAYALIAQGGTALNSCIPRLAADDPIMVSKCRYYDGTSTRDRWVIHGNFQPSEDCTCTAP